MTDTFDYQLEMDFKNLEDELKAAEQEYLQKLQDIVSKYSNKAKQLREESLAQYENTLTNKRNNITQKEQTQSKESTRDIMMDSPIKSSGCTPIHVQKIRESLKRGQELYQINRKQQIENKITNNQTSHIEEDNDDDLNITSNKWSKKLHVMSSSNMNRLEDSIDTNFVEIHKENISDNSSISSLRNSAYFTSNSRFKKQLMVNRLKRKRKYNCIENEYENNTKIYEPAKKKSNVIQGIDLMSSRDLKNELKRIRYKNKSNPKICRKKLLLTKSITNAKNIFKMHSTESESDDDLITKR